MLKFALAGIFALLSSSLAAQATPIEYIFSGDGTGSLNGTSFDGAFTVIGLSDTDTIVIDGSNLHNPASGTFSSGALSATFSAGFQIGGINQPNPLDNGGFFPPNVSFGQSQPAPVTFVAEALTSNSFLGYQLGYLGLTGGDVSFGLQTFLTDGGPLTFTGISDLTFEAVAPGVPEPSTWVMMMLGFAGIGAMVHQRRKAATLAA
jgi:hypothetical protein